MKTKSLSNRILSIILAIIMLSGSLAVMSFAEAEVTQMKLTENNILRYPVQVGTPRVREAFGDVVTLEGGTVTTDGSPAGKVIPGHFEFTVKSSSAMYASETWGTSIKFVPDDAEAYSEITGINFPVKAVVAPATFYEGSSAKNFTASSIESGKYLGLSKITGTADFTGVNGGVKMSSSNFDIKWFTTSVQLTEHGGYCPAIATPTSKSYMSEVGSTPVFYIYVGVTGLEDEEYTEITEFPVIDDIVVERGQQVTASELTVKGGKAVVDGTFEIANPEQVLKIGDPDKTASSNGANAIEVVFKPADESLPKTSIYVGMNASYPSAKIPSQFVDENGELTEPEVHIAAGTPDVLTAAKTELLNKTANCGEYRIGEVLGTGFYGTDNIENNQSNPGVYRVRVKVNPGMDGRRANYDSGYSYAKVIIDPAEITFTPDIVGEKRYRITKTGNEGLYKPQGTFDIYVDGTLLYENIKYEDYFEWEPKPEKSGTFVYTLKAVYKPIEDDPFTLNDAVLEKEVTVRKYWNIDLIECFSAGSPSLKRTSKLYEDKVNLTASTLHVYDIKEIKWTFLNDAGEEFTPDNLDLTDPEHITFTMPDFNMTAEAKVVYDIPSENPGNQGNQGDNNSDFFSSFLAWLNNLLAKFRALMDAVAQLLQVVE